MNILLEKRGNFYWKKGLYAEKGSPEAHKYCQKALRDYDRSKQLSESWSLNYSVLPDRRIHCLKKLSMYDQAISEAQNMCEVERSSDNLVTLAQCYRELRNYQKALDIATEAIQCASNNHYRYYAWQYRGDIYTELGQLDLASQDYQTSESYKNPFG